MNSQRFAELAEQGYNRIPLVLETLADLDTPLSTYLKLASGPYSYLLESAQGGEKWGRYSIIGLPCKTVVRVIGNEITVETNGEVVERVASEDPLDFVEAFQARYRVAPDPTLPRFYGGLVGYFGYDTIRYVERRLRDTAPPDPLGTPDILLMVSEDLVVFDNLRGRMQLTLVLIHSLFGFVVTPASCLRAGTGLVYQDCNQRCSRPPGHAPATCP